MKSLRDVLEKLSRADSKRAERRPAHGFVAHHWSGTAARRDDIKDISSTGLYLLTDERWLPGTVVSLTLQMKSPLEEISERRITVQAKVVRWGDDGVGFSFILPDDSEARPWKFLLESAAEQSEPNGVLDLARLANAIALLSRLWPQGAKHVAQLVYGGLTRARVANAVEILLKAESMLPPDFSTESIGARPGLVLKVLQFGSWADERWIQQLWAGLLVSSCTVPQKDDSNEAFADLLGKLATVHVRILKFACVRVGALRSESGAAVTEPVICGREEIMEIAASRELLRIERDLDHLYGLGLLERRASTASTSTHYAADITPSVLGLQLYDRCKGSLG
ncbi:MAG: PilZ domain-containing protein [Terracidiphilus sp.]